MEVPDNLENVAAMCHEQWAGWMSYLFKRSTFNADGSLTIPAELVHRWQRQVDTQYSLLPEEEKESDRVEALKFFQIFQPNGSSK